VPVACSSRAGRVGTPCATPPRLRALWTGEIAFGLVAIPVKLYSAARDLAPRLHYLHAVCGARIATVRRCPHCDRDVPWDEVAKGHEVAAGQLALFTQEELAELEGESAASGIDIAEFVAPEELEIAAVETSDWVGPAGRSTRSYELLRSVLERTGKVAIGRVRIRTRTRLAMLRPREGDSRSTCSASATSSCRRRRPSSRRRRPRSPRARRRARPSAS
jgi:DNA end-binding protein Ku